MITAWQTAILADLNTIPIAQQVTLHGGVFDEQELRRLGHLAPALLLTNLKMVHRQQWLQVVWAVYVVVRDQIDNPRGNLAMLLARKVQDLVHNNTWGGLAQAPQQVIATNLYNAKLDKQAHALWAVSWAQSAYLTEDIATDDLDDFLGLTCHKD
jgi:hypothetical protein